MTKSIPELTSFVNETIKLMELDRKSVRTIMILLMLQGMSSAH